MSLVSSTIPNLVGGVSQQPAPIRRTNQFEAQTNVYATLVDGLRKRPPTQHLAKMLGSAVPATDFLHTINRDQTERYQLRIVDGDLFVYDMADGSSKTVTFPDGKGYLDVTGNPRSAFRAVTVADYTFIVNTEKVVAMDSATTAAPNPEALLFLKTANYQKRFRVIIDGTEYVSYRTGSDPDDIDTVLVATAIESHLNGIAAGAQGAPNGAVPNMTITRYGHVIHLQKTNTTDFSIQGTDGYGGTNMIVIKDAIQNFTDLPNDAPANTVLEITGDRGENLDNYYVKFVKKNASDSVGVWKETLKKGIKYRIDASTMPHQLIRNGDGTFTFQKATWEDREVGDEATNPEPSFVGQRISDTFFHRNRLGFVAGENVVFSAAADFFRFWRSTVLSLVDDDPVDVAVSSIKVSTLHHALPFNENLLLFSEQSQFELGADKLLTPKTAVISATTEYDASSSCKPVGAAQSVFFAVEQDGYAQVREYYFDGEQRENDAYNTSQHCPRYIPAGAYHMTASTSEDALVVLSSADPSAIYVYKWLADPTQRVQSAWTRWTLGSGEVRNATFMDGDLYIVVVRDNETWLEKIVVASGRTDEGAGFITYLDRRVAEDAIAAGSYNAGTDETSFTLPYPAAGIIATVRPEGGSYAGQLLEVTDRSGTTIKLRGNQTATPIFFGQTFTSTAVLSTIYPKETRGESQNTIAEGRLQLRYLTFLVGNTAYFKVTVQPQGRSTWSKVFNGRVIGSSSFVLGETPLYSGKVRVPIMSNSTQVTITIESDSHLPMSILTMEWEGMFTLRSRRI